MYVAVSGLCELQPVTALQHDAALYRTVQYSDNIAVRSSDKQIWRLTTPGSRYGETSRLVQACKQDTVRAGAALRLSQLAAGGS